MNPYDSPIESQSPGAPSFLRATHKIVLVTSGTAVLFLVLFIGPLVWILRDGLGPDSTTSLGWNAITRMFWCFYWGPATLLASLILVMALCYRRRFTGSDG